MVSEDYRKEVGVYGSQQHVSKPVAIAVMTAVLGVAAFSVSHIVGEAKKFHAAKQTVAPAQTAAQ